MSSSENFEAQKKVIRSVLIPYQKGCYLSEFNRSYRDLIGKRLPIREFNFNSDIELLYAMPDVVRITPTRTGEYHLLGIADEKSKHIQKMVAKQKPSKWKPPINQSVSRFSFSRLGRSYVVPPRFTVPRAAEPEPKIYHAVQPKVPEKPPPPKTLPKEEPMSSPKMTPQEEVTALIQKFKNRLAVDDVLCEYQRMYKKSLGLSKYGFSTIEECIDVIPELEIVRKNNVTFVRYISGSQVSSDVENNVEDANKLAASKSLSNYDVSSAEQKNSNNQNIGNIAAPKSLAEKLQMVAERFTDGVLGADFPGYYEDFTGQYLEVNDLGYRCLSDLIDDFPDIFIRKPVVGSRKDYMIYPASFFSEKNDGRYNHTAPSHLSGLPLVDRVVLNLRKILEAYPEGIKLEQMLNVYSINCKDTLYIKDFGFDNLETFLSSIKHRVPLTFNSINGEKSVHLLKLSDTPSDLYFLTPDAFDKEAIPFDAVFPEFEYNPQSFPPDFDFEKFIPAYTSSVAHAGHLYIQLQGEETGQAKTFSKLANELDYFYNGGQSEQYMMKSIHIKVGASCIAKWPSDQHWYRAQILSIPAMDIVQVFYVDYGTRDTIPKFLLRYAKKEFIDFPAQAIRCRLAFLKPKNAEKWDIQTRDKILNLCSDVPLMAKIEEIGADGIYSILLCDTNGEEDVYINDVLRNDGLAEYDVGGVTHPTSTSPEPILPEPEHNLNPLQALQAQYFLQAFAAVAPSFAQDKSYIKLLKQISDCCQNSGSSNQNIGNQASHSFVQPGLPLVPPGFMPTSPVMNSLSNPSSLYSGYANAAPSSGAFSAKKSNANTILPPVSATDFFSASPEYVSPDLLLTPEITPEGNTTGDNDIFDDDDEEEFQKFCQKVSSTNIQYVKRVMLGDGYKIHIIVIESKPYASSGDISQLIWNNKEADYLLRRLQVKDVDIPAVSLSEDGNEEVFEQLFRFNVKGVQKTTGFKSSIVLYPLKTVIKILNLFGHPSITLRTKLTEEIANFNPNDLHWNDCSETVQSDEEGNFPCATDDDKIDRLCLFDLLAMKEGILCKRKIMLSNKDLNRTNRVDEIGKLEQLHQKVLRRIAEIKEICKVFA